MMKLDLDISHFGLGVCCSHYCIRFFDTCNFRRKIPELFSLIPYMPATESDKNLRVT